MGYVDQLLSAIPTFRNILRQQGLILIKIEFQSLKKGIDENKEFFKKKEQIFVKT